MTSKTAIVAALGALLLGSAACDGEDGPKGGSAVPSTSASASGTAAATAPPATTPGTGASTAAPRPRPTKPEISDSREIVMIDPEGKRHTFRTMVEMAAGMRAAMGDDPPPNFCATSYEQGVREGGKFPAGRRAFMAACQEGWRKAS
ncbi:hypothetical protein GCM10009678_68470 [Actinomadura kijaniata]|uniref:Lipoprotein n=1 Tax=Actinomadura namibiensis TaxID=182080 RepID=A0A7W3LYV1_ACTNM|nr:hypothetical protein [Actinomadura namibiensis]MBA8956811.1 hypothetical protein [Actinomadura namibiensis]